MSQKKKNRTRKARKSSNNKKILIYVAGLLVILIIYIYLAKQQTKIAPQEQQTTEQNLSFRKDGVLDFLDSSGAVTASIDIEIADDLISRVQGLMHRRTMNFHEGMLFLFDSSKPQSMWMRNTYIPLDMMFIREDFSIANIVEDTVPFSEEHINSTEPVKYVLEVNAGFSRRYGIKANHRVRW